MSTELTQEQLDAAMDAEFEKGFNAERGEVVEPAFEPTPDTEAKVESTPEPDPAPEPTPAAAPALAGLTEEQITNALARVSQQQATIDKLGGRIGHLLQQVEQLKAVPRTASEQRSFDLKLTRLGEAFPELAELLREDLKGIGDTQVAPAGAGPATFTAEDVDRIVTEKLTSFQRQQERAFALGAQLLFEPTNRHWAKAAICHHPQDLLQLLDGAFRPVMHRCIKHGDREGRA